MAHARVLSLATVLSLCAFGLPVTAQSCHLASVTPYGTTNPVTLQSVAPGKYMVPGTATILQASAPESISALGLSTSRAQIPLPPPSIGSYLLGVGPTVFVPGGANPLWSFNLPASVPLSVHVYAQSFHTDDLVSYRASNGLDFVVGRYEAEVGITAIDLPPNLIGGIGPRPYRVHFANNGPAPASFVVTVTVGGSFGTSLANAAGNGSGFVDVLVPTPPSFGSKGGYNPFTVTACHDLIDCDPSNNCSSTQAKVYVPYWDLQLRLRNAPSSISVGSGTTARWTVDVTNVGNVSSLPGPASYTFETGINCSSGRGAWSCTPSPPVFLNGGQLGAGQSASFPISYFLPGNTWRQTQWIKAQIVAGDGDPTGNFVEQPVVIL